MTQTSSPPTGDRNCDAPRGVQDPAVAVELVLFGCAVAHPHRYALGVPSRVGRAGGYVATAQGEQCRQPRSLQAAGVQQPAEEPAGLVEFADPQERGDTDAGIPGPGVA